MYSSASRRLSAIAVPSDLCSGLTDLTDRITRSENANGGEKMRVLLSVGPIFPGTSPSGLNLACPIWTIAAGRVAHSVSVGRGDPHFFQATRRMREVARGLFGLLPLPAAQNPSRGDEKAPVFRVCSPSTPSRPRPCYDDGLSNVPVIFYKAVPSAPRVHW